MGHNASSPGADSFRLKKTEYMYNAEVAEHMKDIAGGQIEVFYRKEGYENVYDEIMELNQRLDASDCDLVLSLHFNMYNYKVNGCEALYYHANEETKAIASDLSRYISEVYQTRDRGAKPVYGRQNAGGVLIAEGKKPTILIEPFFGDNDEAFKFEDTCQYAEHLVDFLSCL